MPIVIGIALAGALGAVSRYELDQFIGAHLGRAFPWSTMVINVSGAFAIGILFAVLSERIDASPTVRATVMTGFLGAYTTFSTLTLETAQLIENGSYGLAAFNTLGSLALGMLAIFLGLEIGRVLV